MMRCYIPYLPGTSDELTEEEMQYLSINAQPKWMCNVMNQMNYDWEDLEVHLKIQLIQYLGRLSLIQVSLDKARNKQKDYYNGTKNLPDRKSKSTVTICGYCSKKCHTEAVCHKKKCDEKHSQNYGQNAKTNNAKDNMIKALTETLLNDFGLDDEVSYDLTSSLHESAMIRPYYVDHTLPSDLLTEVIVYVKHKGINGEELMQKFYHIFINTGCSHSLIELMKLPKELFHSKRQVKQIIWKTNAGMYTTKCEVPLNFTLPELTSSNEVEFTLAIDDMERSSRHEMRIGRDLLQVLGNDIFFPKGLLSWNNTTIVQMKSSQ